MPLIRPAVATVAVLHAIGIWNELVLATIYLTNQDLYPITRGLIVFKGVYGNDWPMLAAAVLMLRRRCSCCSCSCSATSSPGSRPAR